MEKDKGRDHIRPSADSPTITPISGSRTRHVDRHMIEILPHSNLTKIYKGCRHCRTQKIKCNGQEPCARCRAFGLDCEYIPLPNQSTQRLTALEPGTVTIVEAPTDPAPVPSSTSSTPSTPGRIRTIEVRGRVEQDTITFVDPPSEELVVSPRPPSDSLSTTPSSAIALSTIQPTTSTPSNNLLQAILSAVDKTTFVYSPLPPGPDGSSPRSDDPSPSPEVMKRLVRLYLRYVHPFRRIIDEHDPDFWTRMDHPMASDVEIVVYAMCTLGGIFVTPLQPSAQSSAQSTPPSTAPTTGAVDDLVHVFHRRTLAVKDSRPKDIATIQALLILQDFYVITNQAELGEKAFQSMLDIAENFKLKERIQRIHSQDNKLSPEDAIVRNVWRVMIWTETMANIISQKTAKIEPLKDLTNIMVDFRSEEVPIVRSPIPDVAIFRLGNLFKIFQDISKIKLPISPRDLYPVINALESMATWHNTLPKPLKCDRSYSTGGLSPLASYLDLYYKLGQIILLNNLPPGVRSSQTALGPRQKSPLRTLATCANGITATVNDLARDPELRNYCMIPAVRCLTEAASIQLANLKLPEFATPAEVNLKQSLWAIKYFNFSVPADVLSATLAPYETAKAIIPTRALTQGQDESPGSNGNEESPTSPSHGEISLASDHNSSTGSTREIPRRLAIEHGDETFSGAQGNAGADVDHSFHGRIPSNSRNPESWHHPYDHRSRERFDPRQMGRGGHGEMMRHRPLSPIAPRHEGMWEDSEHMRFMRDEEGRLFQPYSYSPGLHSRYSSHMNVDQERHLQRHMQGPDYEYAMQDYAGYPRHHPDDEVYSNRPRVISTSFTHYPRHAHEYSPSTPHSATSEASIHSSVVAGYSRQGYPPFASAIVYDGRHDRGPYATSPGSLGGEAQYHGRFQPSRSGSPTLQASRHSPASQRASSGAIRSAEIAPLSSPSSPHSPRVSRTLTKGRSRSSSTPAEPNRAEGAQEEAGARSGRSKDTPPLRVVASSKTDVVGPSSSSSPAATTPTILAGRKRSSISMSDVQTERKMGRVLSIPEGSETQEDIARTYPSEGFYMDPMHLQQHQHHQDGSESSRARELWLQRTREDYEHQRIPIQQLGSHPEPMRSYQGGALQFRQQQQQQHSRPFTDSHAGPLYRPPPPTQYSYPDHISYHSHHQPALSYQHHSRRQQEPRTPTRSVYDSSDDMNSSSNARAAGARYPEHHHYYPQHVRHEHHQGHADQSAPQEQQQDQGGQVEGHGRTGSTTAGPGSDDRDREGEDPTAPGTSDLSRDAARRKLQ